MAVGFQIMLVLLALVSKQFGEPGVLASAGVLGIADMDALTFGMNRLAEAPDMIWLAARAIVLGLTVNSVFKGVIAAVLGAPRYRRLAVPGFLAQALAGAGGFWLLNWLAP
jgi:uncharacterized membrane protein (DUF4010 family)